jgi:hypothetical protein
VSIIIVAVPNIVCSQGTRKKRNAFISTHFIIHEFITVRLYNCTGVRHAVIIINNASNNDNNNNDNIRIIMGLNMLCLILDLNCRGVIFKKKYLKYYVFYITLYRNRMQSQSDFR